MRRRPDAPALDPFRHWLAGMLLAASAVHGATAQTTDLWLDVDTSRQRTDDAIALVQAFCSPEVTVRGVSVLYGNGTLLEALDVAAETLRRVAPGERVHLGARDARDLGTPTPAVDAMADMLEGRRLTIAALGPLTTIASLVRLRPDLVDRIDRLVVVAGRRRDASASSAGDTGYRDDNAGRDPRAMAIVLDAGIPLVLIGREASAETWLGLEDLTAMSTSGSTGAWLADLSRPWLRRNKERTGVAALQPVDALAVGWITHPGRFETLRVRVRLEGAPGNPPADPAAGSSLLVEEDADGGGEILYVTRPRQPFTPLLLDRLGPVRGGGPGGIPPNDAASPIGVRF